MKFLIVLACVLAAFALVEGQCVPGSTWMEACNTCWCFEGGQVTCTVLPCCTPGDVWMEDCNQCACDRDGRVTCTVMICDEASK